MTIYSSSNTASSTTWYESSSITGNGIARPNNNNVLSGNQQKCLTLPSNIPTANSVAQNITTMLQNSGANQECKQYMKTYAAALAGAEQASGQAGFGAASAEESASFAAQMSSLNSQQSGCQQYILNASQMANMGYQMQCIMDTSNQDVTVSYSNVNSININAIDWKTLPNGLAIYTKMSNDYSSYMNNITILIASATSKDAINSLNNLATTYQTSYELQMANLFPPANVTIDNSTFSQGITVNSSLSITLNTTDVSNISALSNLVAQQAANTNLNTNLGVGALVPNSKNLVSQSQDIQNATSSSAIDEKIKNFKLTSTSNNTINITAVGSINLSKVNFTQNGITSIVANVVMQDAITAGLSASTAIVAGQAATLASTGNSAGADALIKALGEANAAAIDALPKPPSTLTTVAYVIGAIILLVVLGYIIWKSTTNKNRPSP